MSDAQPDDHPNTGGQVGGGRFGASDIIALYPHRPPYAPQIYAYIAEKAPAHGHLLDLGCGEGKVARPMTQVFDRVTAVDPSEAMIALGRGLEHGTAPNLEWVCARAEDAALTGRYDLVSFASSLHWMTPDTLFPRLRPHLAEGHLLAIISGDTAHSPAWETDWQVFLADWVPKITGQPLGSAAWQDAREKHLPFVEVLEERAFVSDPLRQSVDSFVLCQQSRDSFAPARLADRCAAFEQELSALLTPYADAEGLLSYRVKTTLTLARLPL